MKQKNIKINKLLSRTWNRLNMNETEVMIPDIEYKQYEISPELPEEGVMHDRTERIKELNISSGMGEEIGKLIDEQGVYSDSFYIKPDNDLEKPLRIKMNYKNNDKKFNYIEIYAGENSRSTVIMEYESNRYAQGMAAIQIKVYAEKNAHIHLIQVQLLGDRFTHLNDIGGRCEEGASINIDQIILGGKYRYLGCMIDLYGAESSMDTGIGYIADNEQELDMNYIVQHKGIKTESNINVNGMLSDNAFKIFRGTIDFKSGASGASGRENENVLMIGEKAVNQTIPIILCEEEDVDGSHGATIGNLDEDMLFYLYTRGFDRDKAYNMMAKARIDAICRKIPDEEISEKINKYAKWGDV